MSISDPMDESRDFMDMVVWFSGIWREVGSNPSRVNLEKMVALKSYKRRIDEIMMVAK